MADGFDNDPIIIDISSDVTDAETARKALAGVDAEINKLRADMNAGTVTFDHYLDQMDHLTAKKGAINDWFTSATSAMKGTAEATAFSGNKLAVFAQGLDDLQYVPEMGLRPILNNVIQLSPALGVAGIAVQTLVSHFGGFAALVGEKHIPTAAEQMKELGDKTQRTADEQARLNKLTREQAAGKSLDESQTAAAKKVQDAAEKSLKEAEPLNLRRSIIDRAPDLTKDDPDLADARRKLAENTRYIADKQKLADTSSDEDQRLRAGRDLAAAMEHRAKLQQKVADEEDAAAQRFINSVPFSDYARKRLIEAIDKDADAFGAAGPKLAADLKLIQEGKDPEEVAKQAEADKKKADKAALDAANKQAGDEAEEGYAAIEAAMEENDKRREELAKGLQGRFNVAAAAGGGDDAVGEDLVRNELAGAGLSQEDVDLYAAGVLDKLQDGYNRELEKRAGKLGTGTAGAADDILAEDGEKRQAEDDKITRERDQMLSKARQGAEAAERDRADQLKRQLAGTNVGGTTRDALMRSLLAGQDPEQAAKRIGDGIASRLVDGGMAKDDARLAADDYVQAQLDKLRDDIGQEAMRGPAGQEMKGPEQRDLASFAASLTLGDIPKQTLDVNKAQLELLAEIARKTGGPARLGP